LAWSILQNPHHTKEQLEEAGQMLKKLVESRPAHIKALALSVKAAAALHLDDIHQRAKEAVSVCAQRLKYKKDDRYARFWNAFVALIMGNREQASQELRSMISRKLARYFGRVLDHDESTPSEEASSSAAPPKDKAKEENDDESSSSEEEESSSSDEEDN
jgi:hypothetical protein